MPDEPAQPFTPPGSAALEAAVDRAALAAILDQRGRPHEAEEALGQALPMIERALGAEHYGVGVALEALATMRVRAGSDSEAAALFSRAATIFERTLGVMHPRTVACRANHDKAKGDQGNAGHRS
jgi:Tetratricopeptide repeat